MKLTLIFRCYLLVFFFSGTFAFGQDKDWVDAKLISHPKPEYPQAARLTGLGGKVSVLVMIDENGNVTSVGEASGPDWVCPSVSREDVAALRGSARTAASKTQFSPATKNGVPKKSTMRLNFEFPKSTTQETEKVYTASGVSEKEVGESQETSTSKLTGGVVNGKATSLPQPPYPPAARAVRASGAVNIEVVIETDGSVFSAVPISGHPLLRTAARNAACQALFQPPKIDGNPVKVQGIITYNFVP